MKALWAAVRYVLKHEEWHYHYSADRRYLMRRWHDGKYEFREMTPSEELSLREFQAVK
jgi:hypothetical protein